MFKMRILENLFFESNHHKTKLLTKFHTFDYIGNNESVSQDKLFHIL